MKKVTLTLTVIFIVCLSYINIYVAKNQSSISSDSISKFQFTGTGGGDKWWVIDNLISSSDTSVTNNCPGGGTQICSWTIDKYFRTCPTGGSHYCTPGYHTETSPIICDPKNCDD